METSRANNAAAPLREDMVIGRNAVLELIKSGRPVECLFMQKAPGGTLLKIAAIARQNGVVVKDAAPQKLDNLCAHANHQGVVALTAAAEYASLEDLFARAEESGEPPFFVIADEIEDPHNLGAIVRSAEGAGAHGVIIPKRRSAGLSFAVYKTSAGAVEHMPVARVSNLSDTIEALKKRGLWIFAADPSGKSWCEQDFSGPAALVVGSEGRGVGRLVRERCDFLVSLPMRGKITSLNASVAAGIILYEIARQRQGYQLFSKG